MKRMTTLAGLTTLSLAMGTTSADAGLMMYFDFNSASGSTVSDLSGNGQDGTLNGTSTLTADGGGHTGLAGDRALTFSGDNFFTATSTVSPGSGDFSVSFWYRTSASGTLAMVDHSQSPDNTQGYQMFASVGGGNLTLWDSSAANNSASTAGLATGDLNGSAWRHIAISVDRTGTNTMRIYINGVETDSTSLVALTDPINFGLLQLGTFNNGQVDSDGFIDDYAIFDEALSQSQIIAIRDGAPVPEPGSLALLGLGGLFIFRRRRG